MIECGIKNLKKYYGANKVFENISFDIKSEEKVGIIGRNGTGKTTLMKAIIGDENFEGDIFIRKGSKIGYLEQIPVYNDSFNGIDVLYTAFEKIYEIKNKMEQLEIDMSKITEEYSHIMSKYGKLQEEFETLDGYNVDDKINKIVEGIGIKDLIHQNFTKLSGGEKTKIILGKVLLQEPDILLLDEPTNHLDLKGVEWLETYLKTYKGSVLIISHDRYFLDNVVSKIIEIDIDGADLYNGNYSYYTIEKERRFLESMKKYKLQQNKIKRMEEQIHRYRVWGAMRDSEVMYVRAKELEKRLEKIDKLDRPILEKTKIKLASNESKRSGKQVVNINELKKGFSNKILFENVNLEIYYKEYVGLLGDNGTGKTTLLNIINGEIEPDIGEVKIGSKIEIGYLSQEIEFSNENISILDLFQREFNITIGEARRELAKVLFIRDDVFKKIGTLSGGEKSRLKLCMILYQNVNLLILDEPTNHLDISSREILEDTLLSYNGTIIFVSHDRYFINKMATKIIEIAEKNINIYNGDYEYYKSCKLKESHKTIEKPDVKNHRKKLVNKNNNKNNSKTLEEKHYEIEDAIEVLERKIKKIEEDMDFFKTDAEKLNELFQTKDLLENELLELYAQWEKYTIL